MAALAGCHKHDRLWESIRDMENRLTTLEQQCKELNTNIESLQVLVGAIENHDYVTGVSTVLENGIEIGYKISFNTHPAVTIYHGKNGGSDTSLVPVIGMKQDDDGFYYWTQKSDAGQSTWILDENGDKIKVVGPDGENVQVPSIGSNGNWWIGETDTQVKAEGNDGIDGNTPLIGENGNGNWWIDDIDTGIKARGDDGKDGVTPQLKIEDDCWMLSVDNRETWENIGQAMGKSIFAGIANEEHKLILELEDGTIIELPKRKMFSLVLDKTTIPGITSGASYEIGYTIIGAEGQQTKMETIAPDGWKMSVQRTNFQSGKITVTIPSSVADGKVLVFATDESGTTLMQSITFLKNGLTVQQTEYMLESAGGDVEVAVETDIDYKINVALEDQTWINYQTVPSDRELFTLTIQPNSGEKYRSAVIELLNENGFVLEKITITQKFSTPQVIHVTIPGTLANLTTTAELNQYETVKITGRLNTLDYDFLKTATDLKTLDITELDMETIPAGAFASSTLQSVLLPKNLITIPNKAFHKSNITSIKIPETVIEIGEYAFYECKKIQGDLIIPNNVTKIGGNAFSDCTFNGTLTLGSSLEIIDHYAFNNCTAFTGDLIIPLGVKEIRGNAFCRTGFTGLKLNEELLLIGNSAFFDCGNFSGNLVIPDKVKIIDNYAFQHSTGWKGYLIIGKSVEKIGAGAFTFLDSKIYKPLFFSKIYFKSTSCPAFLDETNEESSFGCNSTNLMLDFVAIPIGCSYEYLYFKTRAQIFEEIEL